MAIFADPLEVTVDPGYRGLIAFADTAGLRLEPFQREILRAARRLALPGDM